MTDVLSHLLSRARLFPFDRRQMEHFPSLPYGPPLQCPNNGATSDVQLLLLAHPCRMPPNIADTIYESHKACTKPDFLTCNHYLPILKSSYQITPVPQNFSKSTDESHQSSVCAFEDNHGILSSSLSVSQNMLLLDIMSLKESTRI